MKLLIATTTCSKFLETRAKSILNSWYFNGYVNDDLIEHCIFSGTENKDTVNLNCRDDYDSLTEKTKYLFEYCITKKQFDYLVKTNDDTYFSIKDFLSTDFRRYDFGGKELYLNKDRYISGACYFIKKDIVIKCLDDGDLDIFSSCSVEDYIVSNIVKKISNNIQYLNFEQSTNFYLHPVHYSLMSPLSVCSSIKDRVELFNRNPFLQHLDKKA